jgi:hypothetical protein
MLNRSAIVIRHKQPFVDWINNVEPEPGCEVTLEIANEDTTVYLLEVNEKLDFEKWLNSNHAAVFEELLHEWYIESSLWPAKRSLKMLKEWCSFEFHSVVHDTGGDPMEDDGFGL